MIWEPDRIVLLIQTHLNEDHITQSSASAFLTGTVADAPDVVGALDRVGCVVFHEAPVDVIASTPSEQQHSAIESIPKRRPRTILHQDSVLRIPVTSSIGRSERAEETSALPDGEAPHSVLDVTMIVTETLMTALSRLCPRGYPLVLRAVSGSS